MMFAPQEAEEDNVSKASVVPGQNLVNPTMMHGDVLRQVHDERTNTEEKRNDLQNKGRHFQDGAAN